MYVFFLFKQKTAYEMRISDWSSDVCSSDLIGKPFPILFGGIGTDALYVGHHPEAQRIGVDAVVSGRVEHRLVDHVGVGLQKLHVCAEIGRASCRERVCQYV